MGKVKIIGKAEKEFQPDLCDVDIRFGCLKRTADTASKYVNDQCEKLLSELLEKGFKTDNIVIFSDGVNLRTDSYFRRDDSPKEIIYDAFRGIRLTIPAEQNLINSIRDITENGYKNISFSTTFRISNEYELKKQLIKEAVVDSKAQAFLLAGSMEQKIIGIDTANLSGSSDYTDSEDDAEPDYDMSMPEFLMMRSTRPLSD